MLKKMLLAALLALSFFAAVGAPQIPPPGCDPCPWVN
jgi:hypothetical protein